MKMMIKIEKMVMELVKEKVIECGERYKFDGELAFREMMEMKEEKKVKKESNIVLPFSKENVCEDGCQGLKYNLGLFTQCEKKRFSESEYCGGCGEQCEKSEKGIPECGTVGDRLSKGLMEFRDPKGRSPLMYIKLMKKKGWELEDVKREAENKNWNLDKEHLENTTKEKRGRPKKEKKEVESTGITDLFANIVAENTEEKEELIEELLKESPKAEAVEKQKAEALEKETLKKAQAEAKESKQKAQAAAVKEAKEALKKEKEEKKKEEKEAKQKAQAAAVKEAKEALKKKDKKETVVVEEVKKIEVEEVKKVEAVARPKITVSRMEIDGKKYLKSSENILYDPETKEEMGIWNEETNKIMPLPDDEEEEEEEYESD